MATAIKQDDTVVLTMTAEEAATVLYVVGYITGSYEGRRGHTSAVYSALTDANVRSLYAEYGSELLDEVPRIHFTDLELAETGSNREVKNREAKIGDRVRITDDAGGPFFHNGDIGTIVEQDSDGDFRADFNDHGNPEVFGSGCWCIGTGQGTYKWELVD